GQGSMNNEASTFEREDGLPPTAARLCAARLLSETEHRVDRGRQIVARQRGLVAKFGKELPIAVGLLEAFERSLVLLEKIAADRKNRASHQSDEVVIAEQAVRTSRALFAAPIPNWLEPADAARPKPDHLSVAHILKILREGGYDCELVQETLH